MKEDTPTLFVGIDWGEESSQVCVMDHAGRILKERSVKHSGEALERLFEELTEMAGGRPELVALAIETPRGAIVEGLLERGFAVFSINPKQLDRFRDRHTVAGAKDDRRDAFVLADSLRTDGPLFRRVKLDDAVIVELRELSRLRDDLVAEQRRHSNRLRQQLHRFFPQVLELSSAADELWIWALLKLAPTPKHIERLSARRLQKLLERFRIRRLDVLEVARVLSQPPLPVAPGVTEAAQARIKVLVPQLELIHQQLVDCEAQIKALLERTGKRRGTRTASWRPDPSLLARDRKIGGRHDAYRGLSAPGRTRLPRLEVHLRSGSSDAPQRQESLGPDEACLQPPAARGGVPPGSGQHAARSPRKKTLRRPAR